MTYGDGHDVFPVRGRIYRTMLNGANAEAIDVRSVSSSTGCVMRDEQSTPRFGQRGLVKNLPCSPSNICDCVLEESVNSKRPLHHILSKCTHNLRSTLLQRVFVLD